MNPIMQMMNHDNPMSQIFNILDRGMNPQQIAQQILNDNPQARNFLSQMQQQCGNRNPRDFVLEQCRNNGISDQQAMQLANRLGIK